MHERDIARRDLKRAQRLGYDTISIRFKDQTIRTRMRDLNKTLEDMEYKDDLARIPTSSIPMSYQKRVEAGLSVKRAVPEGEQRPGGGSGMVRGQKRWNERQWQEWNQWYYSQPRGCSWRS